MAYLVYYNYFYDVNYFCGLQIEYEIGIKEKESDKRYDVDISYEKITPRTNSSSKGKIYFPPNLSKTVYPMFIDEYKDIFTDKLYSMKSTILFYNGIIHFLSYAFSLEWYENE